MDLQCRVNLAAKYKAASQIAPVLSEDWCRRELYCPACDSDHLTGSRPNNPAVDFERTQCEQPFQLKSLRHWNPRKVVDAGYEAMMRAIRADRTPNVLLLQYSDTWLVRNLLLVPRMFKTMRPIYRNPPVTNPSPMRESQMPSLPSNISFPLIAKYPPAIISGKTINSE